IEGRGKRAAVATVYAPLHFLTTHHLLAAAGAARLGAIERVVDLGCGTGAAGAAAAATLHASGGPLPRVVALDRSGFALGAARAHRARCAAGGAAGARRRRSRRAGLGRERARRARARRAARGAAPRARGRRAAAAARAAGGARDALVARVGGRAGAARRRGAA